MVTRKQKKNAHIHIPRTLVTKYVAMPIYPGFNKGVKLSPKNFEVITYHSLEERPNKKSWEEAMLVAEEACKDFINSQDSPTKWWVMKKGIKSSYRVGIYQHKKAS